MIAHSESKVRMHEKPRPMESLTIKGLGLVEILPEEIPIVKHIRWSAHKAHVALRQGISGSYFFDPQHKIVNEPINHNRLAIFKEGIEMALKGDYFRLDELFQDKDGVMIRGIIRRLINYSGNKKILTNLLKSGETNLSLVMSILEQDSSSNSLESESKGDTDVLIVSHKKPFNIGKLFKQAQSDDGEMHEESGTKIKKKAFSDAKDLLQMLVFSSFGPYVGSAIVMNELEQTEKIKTMKLVDYNECIDPEKLDATFDRNYKMAFLTGLISQDIRKIRTITSNLRSKNNEIKLLYGGLGPTLDPYAVAVATESSVFIGEAEGAMNDVMDVMNKATEGQFFIFHRGLPQGVIAQDRYIMKPHQSHKNLIEVFLNVPQLVNLDEYYSPQREGEGNLANRIKIEEDQLPEVNLFGKTFDPPEWFLNQLVTSVGCPFGCPFCSTGVAHGPSTRRKPIKSLDMQIKSSLGKGFIVLDQNFGAISHGESIEGWRKWMTDFFSVLKMEDKRVFFQTDASFFERATENEELKQLIQQGTTGCLIGVEQPIQVKGALEKDPHLLKDRLAKARELKTFVIATVIVGMLERFTVGHEGGDETLNFSTQEWNNFLHDLDVQVVWPFPLMVIPGATGVPPSDTEAADPLEKYTGHFTHDQKDVRQIAEIMKDYYSLWNITSRLIKMSGYRGGRVFAAGLLNATSHLISKVDMPINDYFRKIRY